MNENWMSVMPEFDEVWKRESYALGYFEGRWKGEENNPYDDEKFSYYKWGYDAGVGDYCRAEHPEEYEDGVEKVNA